MPQTNQNVYYDMKRYFLTTLTIMCVLAMIAAPKKSRERMTFDRNWSFRLCKDHAEVKIVLAELGIKDLRLGETKAKVQKNKVTDDTEPEQAQVTASEVTSATVQSAYGNKEFRSVSVPHDWSIELPFDPQMGGSAGYLAGGQGIYVKNFILPASVKTRSLSITFDGVYHRATVWLNGHRLGHHVYGYTGFSFDITPYINIKGENRLVVHVDREEQSRWYTGSGIYRHVWLTATGATRVKENGIFVIAKTDGNVEVNTELVSGEGKISHTIYDNKGKKVASSSSSKLMVNNPQLWSCDSPVMYTLVTTVKDAKGRVSDEVSTPFGFRDIRFDANTGFWLNGKNMKLKGMCLHQDAGSLGVAVPDEVWLRRLKALKEIGCNAIRCSHNPPSSEFLRICDTLGLLVLDEAFDKWKSGYYEPFYDENAHGDIADMVLRDRNHPSVIVWSIGNEVSEAWKTDDEGVNRARELNDIVKKLDPTRPTMVACQQGFEDKFGEVTDLVGYNYLENRMIADHKRHPNRKMFVAEAFVYYSGLREAVVRDFVEYNPWNYVRDNDFIAGSCMGWSGLSR